MKPDITIVTKYKLNKEQLMEALAKALGVPLDGTVDLREMTRYDSDSCVAFDGVELTVTVTK